MIHDLESISHPTKTANIDCGAAREFVHALLPVRGLCYQAAIGHTFVKLLLRRLVTDVIKRMSVMHTKINCANISVFTSA